MNSRQKIVQQAFLNDEAAIIKKLHTVYGNAVKDINKAIQGHYAAIQQLTDAIEELDKDDPQRAILESMRRSKVYQKSYQEALKKQVSDILDNMNTNQYLKVSDYLEGCYDDGFLGAMYDLHGQGIPLTIPMNQQKIVHAVQLDSKISEGLYTHMGKDIATLKRRITAEISRSMVTGISYAKCGERLNNTAQIGYNNALRIARTEGHRIQCTATMDAMTDAKAKGADVVKQWDATLDKRTRESHRAVDGQIRELDEDFSNGLSFPGDPDGGAKEVIHCRCALLQRARWELDKDELQTLKDRAAKHELWADDPDELRKIKEQSFDDFKKKYLKAVENSENGGTIAVKDVLTKPIKSSEEHYKKLLDNLEVLNKNYNLVYNPVENHKQALSDNEIIAVLSGGDRTRGSCASVALSYIGQKLGWNVLDFRDGESRHFFSSPMNLFTLSLADGVKALRYGDVDGKSSCTLANNFLKQCEIGKEYYLCVGCHASIVRKNDDGVLQYLELQSATKSGWTNFNGNPRYTLANRFRCSSSSGHGERFDFMMNITDSNFNTDDFKSLLGYINTAENEQRKGTNGTIK